MQVEIWLDVVCPWCYLGKTRFRRALESFGHRDEVTVRYRSFELDPLADRTQTMPVVDMLAAKYAMSAEQARQAQLEMQQRAAADGLTFRMADLRSGNTFDAHRLIHLARDRGREEEVASALFAGYFTEQLSIFDHPSLTDLVMRAGLDRDEVTAVLMTDHYADAVRTDEEMARALGATGVPLFVIDRRYGISGAQPAELMTQTLHRARADAIEPQA